MKLWDALKTWWHGSPSGKPKRYTSDPSSAEVLRITCAELELPKPFVASASQEEEPSMTITRGLVIGAAQEEEEPVAGSSEAGTFGIWEERLQTPGLIRSFTMTEADILDHNPLDSPLVQYSNYGVIPSEDPNGTTAYVDEAMDALRFDIPSLTGGDSAGSFFANFSEDLDVQIGENEEVYVQVRVRWNADLLNTFFYSNVATLSQQLGIKFFDINGGDVPGGPEPDPYRNISHLYSSAQQKVVVQTWRQFRLLHAYGYNPVGGGDDELDAGGANPLWQNEYDGGLTCSYNDAIANPDKDGPTVPIHAGCWNMVADEWVTLMLHCSLGPRLVNGNNSSQWTNRQTRLFAAREGEPFTLLFDFNSTTTGYFDHLIAGASDTQWNNAKLGKVWLFPYMTSKDNTQVHAEGTAWYKELLIGREMFAAPIDPPSWMPDAGNYIALGGTNTMRDVAGADINGFQGLLTVLDNWNGGIYASDYGPYGAIINCGSGHSNRHDAFYAQVLASAAANCDWAQIHPYGTYPDDWSEDDGKGDAYGGVPEGVGNRPATPHNYDETVYIPASVYGNTKGALCYPVLSAIGNAASRKMTAWFLDLDADPGDFDNAWSKSTNACPSNAAVSGAGGSAVYDPIGECIWFMDTGSHSHIGKLDIATKTWTSIAHNNINLNTSGTLTGGYCPTLDCFAWLWSEASAGGAKLFIWEPNAERTSGTLTWNATQAGTLPVGVTNLEWCPHASILKFYGMEYVPNPSYPSASSSHYYPSPTARTLTPPASLPGTWTWGSETFTAQGGAGAIGNVSINPRYNAFRWVWKAKSFCWANNHEGPTNFLRPAAAT
jgi:hypothetical protein